ncbi:MAG: hypothetical protein FJ271_07280 [Planctomycetes bacterium]|nr:hypothetical protein [Planctomycetota bacterium]
MRYQKTCPLVVLVATLLSAGCGSPPQMGLDRGVFTTVDALYTAVGIKDMKQVDRCDKTLRDLHAAGRLPEDAFQALQRIINRARDGGWDSANSDLRWFMKGQKR